MKFKCKLSGCVYEFNELHDIETMQLHPQYEVVEEVVEVKVVKKTKGE